MKTIAERRADQKERHILTIMKRCVHFTGIQHEECKAGVNYHAQFGTEPGYFANTPCTRWPGEEPKECPLVKYPTRAEAESEENDREHRSKRAMVAINAVHADAKKKGLGEGHGGVSCYPCPLCNEKQEEDGGHIRYTVASVNGHIHGQCTNGCIGRME